MLVFFFSVNGQTAAGKADAPAAGQTETGEAEDDSDDDKEEGTGAPEAGASGGVLRSHFSHLPPPPPLLANLRAR